MPVDDVPVPAGHAAMDLAGQVQQPRFAGAVIQPECAFDVVAGAELGPIAFAESRFGQRVLPLHEARHDLDGPRVARGFVVALQDIQHQHVRPKIGLAAQAGERLAGTEPAVVALRVHGRTDPLAGLRDDGLVFEHVAQIAVALEPVRHLLPAEVAAALLVGPGTLVEIRARARFRPGGRPCPLSPVPVDAATIPAEQCCRWAVSPAGWAPAAHGCRRSGCCESPLPEYRQPGHRPGRPYRSREATKVGRLNRVGCRNMAGIS